MRVPIGTALFEEFIFRGVLLALLFRWLRPDLALLMNSLLFGLWHVLPALGFADSNAAVAGDAATQLLVVPVTVLLTGVAGTFLAWIRIRSGSLAAPVMVHATLNSSALVAAWLVG